VSHFFGIVLVHKNTERKSIEDAVSDLVDDYNEQKNVPEYESDCWCVGRQARHESEVEAHRRLGTIGDLRQKFHEVNHPPIMPVKEPGMSEEAEKALWKAYNEAEAKTERVWKKAIEPLNKLKKRLFSNHPAARKPDPVCGECGGTGKYRTTSNPNGKWDWWTVGGRWTGVFTPDYDPQKDPRNLEKCYLCEGTGTRKMPVPANPHWRPKDGECNGCGGTGQGVKFSLANHDGDVMPVSKIPQDIFPFCIVTPEGRWHEKGEMGWFGMASNKKDEDVWHKKCSDLFKRHKGCLAVVVDYHV
jgi:hypothetical protein